MKEYLTLFSATSCKTPLFAITDDNKSFVLSDVVGNLPDIFLLIGFDGVETLKVGKHLFVEAKWAENEIESRGENKSYITRFFADVEKAKEQTRR